MTGGADGLGKGITSRLASEGATVVILDINQATIDGFFLFFTSSNFRQERNLIFAFFLAATLAHFAALGYKTHGLKACSLRVN